MLVVEIASLPLLYCSHPFPWKSQVWLYLPFLFLFQLMGITHCSILYLKTLLKPDKEKILALYEVINSGDQYS